MDNRAVEKMAARARAVRARALVRAWTYRQRNLADGVWFRLRRLLANAKDAYIISDEDARRLQAEGYEVAACGRELAPEKTILFVDQRRLDRVESRRPSRVDLGPAFLSASAVALVKLEDTAAPGREPTSGGRRRSSADRSQAN